jgi:hypothetical protein
MAYLDFSPLEGETRVATATDAGRFSSTELRVIDFAQRVDATRELSPRSRFGRFIENVLGTRLPRPLADPRLESLRRFVSLVRHHTSDVGDEDVRALIEAGYSRGQAYGLLAYLGGKGGRTAH